MFSGNKLRLYLAFYFPGEPQEGEERYHTALLLTPKNPDNTKNACTAFHAIQKIVTKNGVTGVHWEFETKLIKARTTNICGVVFLGKISAKTTAEDIQKLLDTVYVPANLDDAPRNWTCNSWAAEAVEVLTSANILTAPTLPVTGQHILRMGTDFVLRKTTTKPTGLPDKDEPVFACDTSGNELESEIGPMES